MSTSPIRRPALYALFALFITLLVILTAAADTGAQAPSPCLDVDGMTLVRQNVVEDRTKCVYDGPWDVFMGYPGYSVYFFCSRHEPDGMFTEDALVTAAGYAKCIFRVGTGPIEGHFAPAGFRSAN